MARSSQLKGTSSFTDSKVWKTSYNETLLWKSMNKFRGSRQSTWTKIKEENKVMSLWEDSLDFIASWGIKTVFVAKVQRNDINNRCRGHLEFSFSSSLMSYSSRPTVCKGPSKGLPQSRAHSFAFCHMFSVKGRQIWKLADFGLTDGHWEGRVESYCHWFQHRIEYYCQHGHMKEENIHR